MLTLYEHQKKALEAVKDKNRILFAMECGLGKTLTSTVKARTFNNKVLVFVQKSLVTQWIEHYEENHPEYKVYDLTKKGNIEAFMNDMTLCCGIINYDLAIRRQSLLYLKDYTLILDESSLIQNHKSKRGQMVLSMKPKNVILLCGSITRYEKLWSQCKLLGWEISKTAFDNRYVNYIYKDFNCGFPIKVLPKINPYRNVDELKAKLIEHGAYFLKAEEAISLPAQNFIDIKVKCTEEYKKFLTDRVIKIEDEELVGDHTFKRYLYKRQLCSSYNPNKIQSLIDLLDSIEDRVIIFYTFNSELIRIKEAIKNRPISVFNGDTKDLTNFFDNPDGVAIIQYKAGSKGLNLQIANKTIFFSPPDSAEDFIQSTMRTRRINQVRPCFYYKLVTQNSIEIDIYKSLAKQEDYKDYLFEREV